MRLNDRIYKVPCFLKFEGRKSAIDQHVDRCLAKIPSISEPLQCSEPQKFLKKSSLNQLQVLILKIINFITKIFNPKFNKIDNLFSSQQKARLLNRKFQQILKPQKMDYPKRMDGEFSHLHYLYFLRLQALLKNPKSLPEYLKELIAKVADERGIKEKTSIIEEVSALIQSQINAYKNYSSDTSVIDKNDRIFSNTSRSQNVIYDISAERILEDISKECLKTPITITMAGVEYAGLLKEGGLAEALEGLAQGLKEQNPENRVKLIFPKFNLLPKEILRQLKDPTTHSSSRGEYRVYALDVNGVECYFLEDPSFTLDGKKPSIYGPNSKTQATRFAKFSELAAELIWEQKDTDIIHLHDWHASGVALKLKKDHQKEWLSGEIPPIVFTFHNNNRSAQGRIHQGAYNYDPVVNGYQDAGISETNENIFVSTLMAADGVTTVSEMFGMEAQQQTLGDGVSFAVKQAAKVGKMVGIINGTNTSRWDPKTDPLLSNWKDPKTNEKVDLSYGEGDDDIVEKKRLAKEQLQKWQKRYLPKANVDFSKPFVTFVGRLDSYQKGLDKLEEAIDATLANGGQFAIMGMSEDPLATKILDKLEKKYRKGVLFIRDYKDPNGRIHFQQGSKKRPGIGSLIRSITDFVFVPSRFEPCGLVQFEGWLFGSLAIGSKTGGLADTILTPETSEEEFNGFLFERGKKKHVQTVIAKALNFWKGQSDEEKNKIMSRLMREGKNYGWHRSPRGLTPAEKYRLTYENAKQNIELRGKSLEKVFKIDALGRERLVGKAKLTQLSAEEIYLKEFYREGGNSLNLHRAYQKVPHYYRSSLPSPYGEGVNHLNYEKYGAFHNDDSTMFRVYAPRAKKVTVCLYDDQENLETKTVMQKNGNGEWEASLSKIPVNTRYHYQIDDQIKIDPYGRSHLRSKNAKSSPFSVVCSSSFDWSDNDWITKRVKERGDPKPMSIFEFHPTSWKKKDNQTLNYEELADEVVKHCQKMGYTHVEPMGILEHFHHESWGYQVSGYFAPNSLMGSLNDFKLFVNKLHQNNIGILLDWVPAHFAKDKYSLTNFDKTPLYEASGIRYKLSIRNLIFSYGCKHFDFQKKEVREFLISSAAFWLKEMHIDGLRVDCVRSLLSSENPESAELFMRDLNAVVHKHCQGAITIAEEYSGDTKITGPTWNNGFGFDRKWHVSMMKHSLDYFKIAPKYRSKNYNKIKKAVQSDNFHKQIMFLSHDQLSEKALINLTPGLDEEKKLLNLKVILSFMFCLPGKKLLFMGSDSGNSRSWKEALAKQGALSESTDEENPELENMMSDLNAIYKNNQEFFEFDDNGRDLDWIEDPKKQIHAYRRTSSKDDNSVCLHNFTDRPSTMTISCSNKISTKVIFNSNNQTFEGIQSKKKSYTVTINPLTTIIIKEEKNDPGFRLAR